MTVLMIYVLNKASSLICSKAIFLHLTGTACEIQLMNYALSNTSYAYDPSRLVDSFDKVTVICLGSSTGKLLISINELSKM